MNTAPRAPHVLIVDDLPEIVHLLEAILRLDGYRVTTATSVQSLARVRELAPDLIIHDLLFGRSHAASMAFLRELRGDPVLGGVPVVLCTVAGHIISEPTMAQELERLDVRVVLKPFSLSTVLRALAETLTTAHLSAHRAGAITEAPVYAPSR